MNYYKRHLGDYAKDAGHLSLLEHGVFTLLLDRYYSTERPITDSDALRVCRARLPAERDAVSMVLSEFFTPGPDGWVNKRADEEIAAYREKAERNREAGKKGGRPSKALSKVETRTGENGNPEETQTVSKKNPSHKPLAISQEEATSKAIAPAARSDEAPAVLIPLVDGTEFDVMPEKVAELSSCYPAVDVLAELRKMRGWSLGNPRKRKTRRGITAFMSSWLSRAQDDASKINKGSGNAQAQRHGESAVERVQRSIAENRARDGRFEGDGLDGQGFGGGLLDAEYTRLE